MSVVPEVITGKRSLGIGLVGAIVAGSLALSFGTGYVANKAVLGDGAAWLRQGQDAALVSGSGGQPQDEAEGLPEGTIVQGEDGTFHVAADATDGEGRTFTAQGGPAAGRTLEGGEGSELLSGPAGAWLVEPATGRIQPVDELAFEPVGEPIEVGQPLVGQSVDVDGTLWVLDDDGRARALDGDELGPPRPLDLGDPEQSRLATVGDRAVVADPVTGRVTVVGGSSWVVPGLEGGRVEVAPQQPGPVLALAVLGRSSRSLLVVDLDAGEPLPEVDLGPDPVAAPLPVDQRVYVPTVADGEPVLRRFDLPGLPEGEPVAVPSEGDLAEAADGALGFDAFLEGTRVWANDPRSDRAVTVGEGEESREVNKLDPSEEGEGAAEGEGDQATEDEPPIPEPPAPADPGTGSEPPIATAPEPEADVPAPAAPPAPVPPAPPPPPPPPPPPATAVGVRVPDVVDLAPDAACARLQQAGLTCAPEAVADDDLPVDRVFAQRPEAGTEVDAGRAVTVEFAVRSRVEVPAIEGLASADAVTALEAAGLEADPQERTDAGRDDPLDVVLAGQEPAAGETVETGSAVTFTYYSARAPLPFDPALALGQRQDAACTPYIEQGFTSCTPAQGVASPDDAQAGLVYATDPATAGEYPVDQPITLTFYAPRALRQATMDDLAGRNGCAAVEQFNAEHPGMNLQCAPPQPSPTPPPGIMAINGVISHTPGPGEVVTENQVVTVYVYQPALRPVIDWQRIAPSKAEATHWLRGPEEGAPSDSTGRPWQSTATMQLFAGPEPGSVPVYCWTLAARDGTERYFCGTNVPPQYDNPNPWVPLYGGAPIGYAYDNDPGTGAIGRFPCGLVAFGADGQRPIGSYYNGAPACTLPPDNTAESRYEPWDAFWTVG